MSSVEFTNLRRQQFRQYFQPSRIVLGVIPAPTKSGVNVITLCFDMYCSYKPPMMAIAVQNVNASYKLIQNCEEFVLAVPGVSMVQEALFCGTRSMTEADKVEALGLKLCDSTSVAVPGLQSAIANIELTKETCIRTGDHMLCIGSVRRFAVNKSATDLPLLSVGPDTRGYKVLATHGIHRIATVAA